MSVGAEQIQEGQLLAGKYQVERLLGQGGMGVVLAARHVHLGERVAIKLLRRDAADTPGAVTRFVREARAAARLESVHVARVSDVGVLDDQRPFMVMEYLDGTDLEVLLSRSGPLGIEVVVDYVLQAAEAIAEAHSLGIVHRDLKPSNLFLTQRRDGVPLIKVLDFGISKSTDASVTSLTVTSSLMGSPAYMSPEQMTASAEVDGRTDIWSLGVIMYELLAGSPPFLGDTLPQVCARVLQREPVPLTERRPEVTAELAAVVTRCLAKSPSERYPSVLAFAQALQGVAGQSARASIERIMHLSGSVPGSSLSAVSGEPLEAIPGRRRLPLALPLALGGAALLVAGTAFWLTRSAPPTASSARPETPTVLVASTLPPGVTATLPPPSAAPVPEPILLAPDPPAPVVPAPSATPARRKKVSAAAPAPVPRSAPVTATPTATPASARSAEMRTRGFGGRL